MIADTSALISLAIPTDANHRAAVASAEEVRDEAVTILVPWDVYAELVNTLGKQYDHAKALTVARYVATTPLFLIVNVSDDAKLQAHDRFGNQPRSVSFTDCLVMAVADEYGTKRIFGFDEAFTKNGYEIIQGMSGRRAA